MSSAALTQDHYDHILSGLIATPIGRAFLAEHESRCRVVAAETVLAKLDELKEAQAKSSSGEGSPDGGHLAMLRRELIDMSSAINQARREIAAIKPESGSDNRILAATEELDAIVTATERATSEILNAAEAMSNISNQVAEAGRLDLSNQLLDHVTAIFMACSFQDITGQRTTKVVHTLRYIEQRINSMMSIWRGDSQTVENGNPPPLRVDNRPDAHLLNGPALPADQRNQDDIDALFNGSAAPTGPAGQNDIDALFDAPAPAAPASGPAGQCDIDALFDAPAPAAPPSGPAGQSDIDALFDAPAPAAPPSGPAGQSDIDALFDAPAAPEPVAEAPPHEAPVAHEPVAEEPPHEAPVDHEPVAEEPPHEAPVAHEPVAEEPPHEAPVAYEPVAAAPAAEPAPFDLDALFGEPAAPPDLEAAFLAATAPSHEETPAPAEPIVTAEPEAVAPAPEPVAHHVAPESVAPEQVAPEQVAPEHVDPVAEAEPAHSEAPPAEEAAFHEEQVAVEPPAESYAEPPAPEPQPQLHGLGIDYLSIGSAAPTPSAEDIADEARLAALDLLFPADAVQTAAVPSAPVSAPLPKITPIQRSEAPPALSPSVAPPQPVGSPARALADRLESVISSIADPNRQIPGAPVHQAVTHNDPAARSVEAGSTSDWLGAPLSADIEPAVHVAKEPEVAAPAVAAPVVAPEAAVPPPAAPVATTPPPTASAQTPNPAQMDFTGTVPDFLAPAGPVEDFTPVAVKRRVPPPSDPDLIGKLG